MVLRKKGGFTDLFIFIIMTFIIVISFGVFIYIGQRVETQLHTVMDDMDLGDTLNNSKLIDDTMGKVNDSYNLLYGVSIIIIIGMIISIFIGSYLVTTKPIFFVPYLFVTIIAIILSVAVSNAYEQIVENETLSATFLEFTAANFILLMLPLWVTIIGFVGMIIMFSRMGSGERHIYG